MRLLSIQNWRTENGTPALLVERHENPMLEINVVFAAGSAYDENKYGISQLTNIMLNQGSKSFDANKIAENFEEIGAKFRNTSDRDTAAISLLSLTNSKYLNPAIATFTEVLSTPTFPADAFLRMQKMVVGAISQQEQMPQIVARNVFYATIYPHHPYGQSVLGTIDSVLNLTINDLKAFYSQYYVAKNAIIILVGNIQRKKAVSIANQIALALPTGKMADKIAPTPSLTEPINRRIQFPSEQTQIIIGQPGINYLDPRYFPILVGNHILGGSPLVSRLFRKVRNKHGLAYSVNSHIASLQAGGIFSITLQTRKEQTANALKMTFNILENFITKGPTKQELTAVKRKMTNGFPLSLVCNSDISNILCTLGSYHLPLNYLDEYCTKINNVTSKEIKDAFQVCLPLNRMATVLV